MGNNSIISCVLGISKIGNVSNFSYNFSHVALLLLQKDIDVDIYDEKGIFVKYGDYSKDMCD